MRVIPFLVSGTTTLALIFSLNVQWGSMPPIGRFLSPQHGFWQNAESIDEDFDGDLQVAGLKGKASVFLDDRLVPHVFAEQDADLYFIQGYLHAKFRLWQMEFQVFAAAGRISELVGVKGLNFDRDKRRLGMVYAAEKSVQEIEKDSLTKMACDSYTAGVNAYISQCSESALPVEYKLLNYHPEKWTNLKTALLLKYMTLDLAGFEQDFQYTNARSVLGWKDFEKMYPYGQDSLDPIIPKGMLYPPPGVFPAMPAGADSLYFRKQDSMPQLVSKPDKDNGSNNWAISGKVTQSGAPILCNDPHLSLSMPSLWFENQLSSPGMNIYGASLPGSPGVVIGFNDSCAFGLTNAMRDVRDYYEIRFKEGGREEYWFNGAWTKAEQRIEHIGQKEETEFIDTVAYTVFGPVMYDSRFTGGLTSAGKSYAVRWKGHDASNEVKSILLLDHAKNYDDYYDAIQNLHTPGQNFVFASKTGDIAIWDQGEFPAKWKGQGDFVMPGIDSSYMWQGSIPQQENPHLINPQRNFVSSANQYPADPAVYPYYLGGQYPPYRGYIINRYLGQMTRQGGVTIKDMIKLQTENYNVFAEMAMPLLMRNIDVNSLAPDEKKYYDLLAAWSLRNDPDEKGCTVFSLLWDNFTHQVWDDELKQTALPMALPVASTLLEGVLRDSAFKFLDNINTERKETLMDDVMAAFKKTVQDCRAAENAGKLEWAKYKGTSVNHLLRLTPFSRKNLPIGGGVNCINAAKENHGPSWRMVVQLSEKTEAFGIYPGGQSGNPGSIYYDNFVDNWAAGRYYPLWVMAREDEKDQRVKARINFSPQ